MKRNKILMIVLSFLPVLCFSNETQNNINLLKVRVFTGGKGVGDPIYINIQEYQKSDGALVAFKIHSEVKSMEISGTYILSKSEVDSIKSKVNITHFMDLPSVLPEGTKTPGSNLYVLQICLGEKCTSVSFDEPKTSFKSKNEEIFMSVWKQVMFLMPEWPQPWKNIDA